MESDHVPPGRAVAAVELLGGDPHEFRPEGGRTDWPRALRPARGHPGEQPVELLVCDSVEVAMAELPPQGRESRAEQAGPELAVLIRHT